MVQINTKLLHYIWIEVNEEKKEKGFGGMKDPLFVLQKGGNWKENMDEKFEGKTHIPLPFPPNKPPKQTMKIYHSSSLPFPSPFLHFFSLQNSYLNIDLLWIDGDFFRPLFP